MGGRRRAGLRLGVSAALVIAVVAVVWVAMTSGTSYEVRARFDNSSQLVKGDRVQIAGQPVGSVTSVKVAGDGQAEIGLKLDGHAAPLRRDTRLVVRLRSLLGVANRYIDLQPGQRRGAAIPSGGLVRTDQTQSTVDFDAVLDLLGPRQRQAVRRVIAGSSRVFDGKERQANEGLAYLAPALSTTDRVTEELARDRPGLRRLIVRGADLSGDIATKRRSLTALIQHLSTTGTALAERERPLREGVARLPVFLDRGQRTFNRLRVSLRTLRPLVRESRPTVRRLRPFFADLRAFARGARPTVRDLSATVHRAGPGNDLRDLLQTAPPLAAIATRSVRANGAKRAGAFPATAAALKGSTPMAAFFRPYSPELTGWFNDFGTSGIYDANGGLSRSSNTAGAFQLLDSVLYPIPPELRAQAFQATASLGNTRRCPGALERNPGDGSTPVTEPGLDCDPKEVPPGP